MKFLIKSSKVSCVEFECVEWERQLVKFSRNSWFSASNCSLDVLVESLNAKSTKKFSTLWISLSSCAWLKSSCWRRSLIWWCLSLVDFPRRNPAIKVKNAIDMLKLMHVLLLINCRTSNPLKVNQNFRALSGYRFHRSHLEREFARIAVS